MSESQEKVAAVFEKGSDAVVVWGGIKVRFNGSGGIDVYGDVPVALHPVANDVEAKAAPEIGEVMPAGQKHAGWIYVGISETTNEPFYAAPKDSGRFKWKEAMAFAARKSARVPSREELKQLCDAQDRGALKGTFNVSGSRPGGWYWSATEHSAFEDCAWGRRFDDGLRQWNNKADQSSLRLIRRGVI